MDDYAYKNTNSGITNGKYYIPVRRDLKNPVANSNLKSNARNDNSAPVPKVVDQPPISSQAANLQNSTVPLRPKSEPGKTFFRRPPQK